MHVKVIRRSDESRHLNDSRLAFPRQVYFFYEKNTGVSHFHIEAGPDGRFPVDQAAGLLAMHCMVRGQSPADYVVMIEAETNILEGLQDKAEKLLQAGQSISGSVKLTRREEEVLGGVMRSLANKEIAATLNLSERTVKFHVSSLLAKFGVRGRMELVREASRKAIPPAATPLATSTNDARNFAPRAPRYDVTPRRASLVSLAKPQMMA
jgi:DNA-binding CsgD family transcriptional regulator